MDVVDVLNAVCENDPDGYSINRVFEAACLTIADGIRAGEKGLYKDSSENCLLAHAWKAKWVDNELWCDEYGVVSSHPHKEVVHWFDSFSFHQEAASRVYEMLKPYYTLRRFEDAYQFTIRNKSCAVIG